MVLRITLLAIRRTGALGTSLPILNQMTAPGMPDSQMLG